jgi:CheY-like chemotaxis protein
MKTGIESRLRDLLLVEDSFGDAILAEEAFAATQPAVRLSIATDGEEALSKLRLEHPFQNAPRPELVLLDLNLPRMGGRAVLEAIRTDPKLNLLPVIVMTASDAAADIHDSYALGANGYIVKPMHFEGLLEIAAAIRQFWFGVAALPPATNRGESNAA